MLILPHNSQLSLRGQQRDNLQGCRSVAKFASDQQLTPTPWPTFERAPRCSPLLQHRSYPIQKRIGTLPKKITKKRGVREALGGWAHQAHQEVMTGGRNVLGRSGTTGILLAQFVHVGAPQHLEQAVCPAGRGGKSHLPDCKRGLGALGLRTARRVRPPGRGTTGVR